MLPARDHTNAIVRLRKKRLPAAQPGMKISVRGPSSQAQPASLEAARLKLRGNCLMIQPLPADQSLMFCH